ncbi:ParB/RepB/Spo0J family partition protein [Rhodoferax sp. WC2427]|uniref:ParB/RepB/Spo0J family partition protein n=1 Tax=Rhodoferax sp. WC2427 TaxID=3234144 RepID=UPI0034664020
MNAPTFADLPLSAITPSLTNPRKTFHPARLAELTASIASSGVHQPILVRPLPASRLEDTSKTSPRPEYELVAGERRYRASLAAKRDTIPAMVRDLTDDQVLEIQIVENLQREDIAALEEAEGYERLMQHSSITAEQVGDKIGKSRSYVYARLKLLDLCQEARSSLRDGSIDSSRALLIARIPDHKLQIKAIEDILMGVHDYSTGETAPMGQRAAAAYIQRKYMLKLDTAKFDILRVDLVPNAGSCKTCAKRTGHEPDLFADVKNADVCTDPPCFHKKEEAHNATMVAEAQAKGQTIIAGKEAQELMPQHSYNAKFKGYRRLDDAADSPTNQPLRKIIGKQMDVEGIAQVMIEHPYSKGTLVAVLANEVVLRLLKTVQGQAAAATKTVDKEVQQFADEKAAKAQAKATEQFEQGWRDTLLSDTWHAVNKDDVPVMSSMEFCRYLARREAINIHQDNADALCKLLDLGKVSSHSAVVDFVKTTDRPDLALALLVMQRDSGRNHYAHGRPPNEGLMLVAEIAFGDKLKSVIKDIKAEAQERFLPKPKAAEPLLPHSPAAQAEGEAGGGKSKNADGSKKTRPAAPAAKAKTTAEEAALGIAQAMQGIESAALAAEGSDLGADAQGIDATALAVAGTSERPAQEPSAAAIEIGQRVRVLVGVKGPNAKYVGKEGLVRSRLGAAWMLMFTGKGSKVGSMASFDRNELEVVES